VLALEQNTTFNFGAMHRDFEVMPQVKRLLALNRGGRRLLSATGESVPPLNQWPRILARSSNNADVLFHFLREIPNVLVEKAGSRKRKRGDDDETNYEYSVTYYVNSIGCNQNLLENDILYKTDHFLRASCLLHFADVLVAVGSFDFTGRLENEQESIPANATDNRFRK
jgi:hypothetical protein